jgi:hypothetical protein
MGESRWSMRSGCGLALVAAAWCLVPPSASRSAYQPAGSAVEAMDERVRNFLLSVGERQSDAAVSAIVAGGPLARDEADLTRLKQNLRTALDRVGRYVRSQKVRSQAYGSSLVRCTYLLQGEDYPLVWRFTFYRSGAEGSDWKLISLQFDLNYDSLPVPEGGA